MATAQFYDRNKIDSLLSGKVSKAGDTMSGGLTVPTLTVGSRASGSSVGVKSVSEGHNNVASEECSHAEGQNSTASEYCSHAEGYGSTASGYVSHAEGQSAIASGYTSHAEGYGSTASGATSHAEGSSTASGDHSHAEGSSTASGDYSHAEGASSTASGATSHAEGSYTTASGVVSHSEGSYTTAQNYVEHAQGAYNASHTVANSSFGNSGNTLSSIGFGTALNNRKNAVETMQDGKTFIYGLGGYDGTNPTGSGVKDLVSAFNGKVGTMESVTWQQLKDMRDANNGAGSLVPGQQYRITDYVATTTQADTQSANHPFDIVVTADAANKLNEVARAVKNSADTYFSAAGCKLEAWKVWYCLDNDTNRFAWADATSGRGVVYWMKDEFDNECPYDFKGITMKAYGDTDNVFRYTFDSGEASDNTDLSLQGGTSGDVQNWVFGNVIRPYLVPSAGYRLNITVFKGSGCVSNTLGDNCSSNTFGGGCVSNMLDCYCSSNTFGSECVSNTFGSGCVSNMFGSSCSNNTFGSSCSNNKFGNNCASNTFGSECVSNTLGDNCYSNTLGSECVSNTLGSYCSSNTFDSGCSSNTLDEDCVSNMFGGSCSNNTFGSSCSNNTFGIYCIANTFGYRPQIFSTTMSYAIGDLCWHNGRVYRCTVAHTGSWNRSHFVNDPLSVASTYYQHITFENGVDYVFLDCTATRTGSEYYQNVTVSKGILGTISSPKSIQDSNKEQAFKTTYQPAESRVVSV